MSGARAETNSDRARSKNWAAGFRRNWRDYAQLIRLPNVFTAFADIALGGLCAWGSGASSSTWLVFPLLLLSSACLYSSGMAWNDFFDLAQDSRERPFRPIPSGRISRLDAAMFAGMLQILGLLLAGALAFVADGPGWAPLGLAA